MKQAERQTISYLTRRLAEVGLKPNTRHGQNFLIDYNLIELLANSAELGPDDVVLEIGTGTGALTGLLARQSHRVVTVELDPRLFQLAREELEAYDNVTMLNQDALKNKNRIHANVIQAVETSLAARPGLHFKLAANLPYNIATPVIANMLQTDVVPKTLTVTIQKELADRLAATPSTKDYSALSVWVQSICDVRLIRAVPPSVFWPRPKVHSAIIQLVHRPENRQRIGDTAFFHRFVRSLFFHRRKFLRSVVASAFKGQLDKRQVDSVLLAQGLDGQVRAEQLSVQQLIQLSHAFGRAVAPNGA